MNRLNAMLAAAGQRQDVVLIALVIMTVFMIILPLPTMLVDTLIALNIMVTIILLTIAICIRSPFDFSVFPALLLITTFYRLALTITTSRLILLQADAGKIVHTFGSFVIGGNVAVGMIVFTIITVVQFIVITKGAERVAEVSARFSLDGMPGRQMSIDGDIRAGALTPALAKSERDALQKESRFYGAMDGAMKFVKGDAIASIIVVLVNIIGGIVLGVAQKGMSASQAVSTYAILSVGDGLIAQIPALLISMTAGLIVTRIPGSEQQNLAGQMIEQLLAQPPALIMAGAVLFLFALIPGFPALIFGLLAALIFGLWYLLSIRRGDGRGVVAQAKAKTKAALPAALSIRTGEGAVDPACLAEALEHFRRDKFDQLGLPLPLPDWAESPDLSRDSIEIQLYQVPVVSVTLPDNAVLVAGRVSLSVDAEVNEIRLPWGVTLWWLPQAQQDAAIRDGLTVYAGEHRITALLDAVVARYAEDFIGLQETRALLDTAETSYPELVRELQRNMPLHKVAEIIRRLVSEGIPIRDLRAVFEALVDWSSKEKDVVLLTEYVRIALRRQICHSFSREKEREGKGRIAALLVGERIENMIRESIRQTSAGSYSALDARRAGAILNLLKSHLEAPETIAQRPVLLTAMDVRRYLRKMIEREYFKTPVLSTQELTEDLEVNVLGNLDLFDEDEEHFYAAA